MQMMVLKSNGNDDDTMRWFSTVKMYRNRMIVMVVDSDKKEDD